MSIEVPEDIFEIDMYELDREWVRQPKLFFNFARQLADAREQVERSKAEMDVVKAEMDQEIRNSPEDYDIGKVTEAAITAAIAMSKEMKQAQSEFIRAKHNADILQGAVNALEHRKSALERLVSLHGQNYFSTPVADSDGREAKESMSKTRNKKKARKRKESEGE